MAGRVSDKVALITGGGSGLGAADCLLLAREGAHVVVTDIDPEAAHVANRIGERAIFLQQDVSSEAAWLSTLAEVRSRFGRLDILVNNAGIGLDADIEQTTLEMFRRAAAIMSEGVFLGCKHAIPLMRESGGGSIVNIASTATHLGYSGAFAYSAAKGSVRAMTKATAVYCQDKGYRIRCNSVHPGSIETPLERRIYGLAGEVVQVPPGVLPPGARGAAEDVAELVLFLASDAARFITGAEYLIDNGATIRPEHP